MDYSLEMCSLYDKRIINDIPVVIFEDHNMALPVWGTYASKLKQPLRLFTFDYHADTHDPFAGAVGPHDFDLKRFEENILCKIKYDICDFNFEDVYKLACGYVRFDEHILTAYKFDYLTGYHIFCALSNDELVNYERDDRRRGINAFYHARSSIRNMKNEEIQGLCDSPFILDFDLDYFASAKMFDEVFSDKLAFLIKNATVITIARERDCFESKRADENFQNDEALTLLLDLINDILKK